MQMLARYKRPEPGQLAQVIEALKVGEVFEKQVTPTITRWTGLSSSATQQAKDSDGNLVPVDFTDILDGSDAVLTRIYTGAPAGGEVKITFDSSGYPIFTFNAAVTAFGIMGKVYPKEAKTKQTQELL